ncbi:hypothetical protein DERF_004902 [Dermatophagoides farinae]|uniref:Uncharacterized protein n=1 Tax=Dermatophagoides farinae TaxID=6954 RepID=A0A922L6M7_DERFA|nr:hypothetical protein DERF_004902 [Dermatophagoides farinae]
MNLTKLDRPDRIDEKKNTWKHPDKGHFSVGIEFNEFSSSSSSSSIFKHYFRRLLCFAQTLKI